MTIEIPKFQKDTLENDVVGSEFSSIPPEDFFEDLDFFGDEDVQEKNLTGYGSTIDEYYKSLSEGKSPLIKAMMQVESAGNPFAVGPARKVKGGVTDYATGPMQIMSHTAEEPGFEISPITEQERNDPERNVKFGEEYMNVMLKKFGGNTEHALMAYNWGPGITEQWIEAGSPRSDQGFKDKKGVDRTSGLKNAKDYVKKVMSKVPSTDDLSEESIPPAPTDDLAAGFIPPAPTDDLAAGFIPPDTTKTDVVDDRGITSQMEQLVPTVKRISDIVADQQQYESDSKIASEDPNIYTTEGAVPYYARSLKNRFTQDQFKRRKIEKDQSKESFPVLTGGNIAGDPAEFGSENKWRGLDPKFSDFSDVNFRAPLISGAHQRFQMPSVFNKQKLENRTFINAYRDYVDRVWNRQKELDNNPSKFSSTVQQHNREYLTVLNAVTDSLVRRGYNNVKYAFDYLNGFRTNTSKSIPIGLSEALKGTVGLMWEGSRWGDILRNWSVNNPHPVTDRDMGGAIDDIVRWAWRNKNAPWTGLQNHIELENQFRSGLKAILSDKDTARFIGITPGIDLWNDIQDGLNIPDEEMNHIYRAIIFGSGFATLGGAGTMARGLGLIDSNLKRVSALHKVARATNQEYKFGRLWGNTQFHRPEYWEETKIFENALEIAKKGLAKFPKKELERFGKGLPFSKKFRADVANSSDLLFGSGVKRIPEDSAISMSIIEELRKQFAKAGMSKTRANSVALSRSFDFHMGISAMAGYSLGNMLDVVDETTGEQDTSFSTILGMAGSFVLPNQTKRFLGTGAGWLHKAANSKTGNVLGAVGSTVAAMTPLPSMIRYFKGNRIEPKDVVKSRFRMGALLSKGYTVREVNNMSLEAEKKGIAAMRKLEEVGEQYGYNTSKYIEQRDKILLDGTLYQGDSGELLINRWSVMEKRKDVHVSNVNFLKAFYQNMEQMDSKELYKGSDAVAMEQKITMKQKIKQDISESFKLIDELEEKFPSELGGAEFLLNHMLHLNVIQALKESSAHSITASALNGKFISKPHRILDMNKWDRTEKLLVHRIHQMVESTKSNPNSEETRDQLLDFLQSRLTQRRVDSQNSISSAKQILTGDSRIFDLPEEILEKIQGIRKKVSIDNFGSSVEMSPNVLSEKNKTLLFGARNQDGERVGGIIQENRRKTNETYEALKKEAANKDIDIDITDFLNLITKSETATGSTLPDIFNKRALPIALAKSFTEKVVKQSLNKLVPGDTLKQRLIFINDNVYKNVNESASNEFTKFLLDNTDEQLEVLFEQGLIQKMFSDISASEVGKSAAIGLPDFIQLRSGFKSMAGKVLDSSDTNIKYRNIKSLIDSLNDSIVNTNLAPGLRKADKQYRETVSPFWNSSSSLHKIFKSRSDEYAPTAGENLFVGVIKHPNQEQNALLFKNIMQNADEDTKKELVEGLYYTLARGLRYKEGEAHIKEEKILGFLDRFDFMFKGTKYADDISALRTYSAHNSDTLVQDATEQAKKSLKVIADIINSAQERLDAGKIPDIAILAKITNYDKDQTIDGILDTMLGKSDELGVPTTSLTKLGHVTEDMYNAKLESIAGSNKKSIEEVKEQFGSWQKIKDTLRNIDSEFDFGPDETISNVDFLKYYFKRFHSNEEFDTVMKNLQDLTTHRILTNTFPVSRSSTGEFTTKQIDELARQGTGILDKVSRALEKQYPKRMHKELLRTATKVKKEIDKGVDRRDISPSDLAIYDRLAKANIPLDRFTEKTTFQLDREMNPVALHEILTNKRTELAKIYGKDHVDLLDRIFAFSARMKSSEVSPGTNVTGMQGDYTMNNAQARAFAVVRGVLSPRYAIGEFSLVQFRMQRFQITRELFNDPLYAQVYKDIFLDGNLDNMESMLYFAKKTIGINLAVQARLETYAEKYGMESIYDETDFKPHFLKGFDKLDFEKGEINEAFFRIAAVKLREELKTRKELDKETLYLQSNYPARTLEDQSMYPQELEYQGARNLTEEERLREKSGIYSQINQLSPEELDQAQFHFSSILRPFTQKAPVRKETRPYIAPKF